MTDLLRKGRYIVRLAQNAKDIADAQALRGQAFRLGGPDADDFDLRCAHVLIHDRSSGALVCCFRMMPLASGGEIAGSYSAQYYELSALSAFKRRMMEMGRFCVARRK